MLLALIHLGEYQTSQFIPLLLATSRDRRANLGPLEPQQAQPEEQSLYSFPQSSQCLIHSVLASAHVSFACRRLRTRWALAYRTVSHQCAPSTGAWKRLESSPTWPGLRTSTYFQHADGGRWAWLCRKTVQRINQHFERST